MAHSEEVKAAVMQALLAGQSISSAAKEYNIPRGTVADWSSRLPSDKKIKTISYSKYGKRKNDAITALKNGKSVTDVSLEFDIPRGTVAGWSALIPYIEILFIKEKKNKKRFKKKNQENTKFLYLVKEDFMGLVKIGVAKDMKARFSALNGSCPQSLEIIDYFEIEHPTWHEKELHQQYKAKCYSGEWFELSSDDVRDITEYLSKLERCNIDNNKRPKQIKASNVLQPLEAEQAAMFDYWNL